MVQTSLGWAGRDLDGLDGLGKQSQARKLKIEEKQYFWITIDENEIELEAWIEFIFYEKLSFFIELTPN